MRPDLTAIYGKVLDAASIMSKKSKVKDFLVAAKENLFKLAHDLPREECFQLKQKLAATNSVRTSFDYAITMCN